MGGVKEVREHFLHLWVIRRLQAVPCWRFNRDLARFKISEVCREKFFFSP